MKLRCPIKKVGASTVVLDFPTTQLIKVFTPEKYGAKADGVTDDTASIQAALDNITRGILVLSYGKTYYLGDGSAVLSPDDDTLIWGYGATLTMDCSTSKAVGSPTGWIDINGKDNVVIWGLRMVEANDDDVGYWSHIRVNNSTRVKIEDCYLDNEWESAIKVKDSSNVEINNVEALNVEYRAIEAIDSTGVIVRNCKSHDNGSHGLYFQVTDTDGCVYTAENNLLYNNGQYGLMVYDHASYNGSLNIIGNKIYGNTLTQLVLGYNGKNINIRGNYIKGEKPLSVNIGTPTVAATNIVIDNNDIVFDTGETNAYLEIYSLTDSEITNNRFADASLFIRGGRGIRIERNRFIGTDTTTNCIKFDDYADALTDPQDIYIIGNYIYNYKKFGIYLEDATGYWEIKNNRIDTITKTTVSANISLYDQDIARWSRIENNILSNAVDYGIYANAHECIIKNNTITDAGDSINDDHAVLADVIDGRAVAYFAAAPTAGTWVVGDIVWDTNAAAGAAPGWYCTGSGTFSAATDNTGDTDGSTAVITGMTDTSDFYVGEYIKTSAGFPSSEDDADTPVKIISKTATTLTIDDTSDTAENNITVDTDDPTWKAMGSLAA